MRYRSKTAETCRKVVEYDVKTQTKILDHVADKVQTTKQDEERRRASLSGSMPIKVHSV